MSTFFAKQEEQKPRWFIIDADGQVLGKIAVRAANILRGKTKPTFTAHVDTGDCVVVVNAEKVVLTGKKEVGKKYMKFSGFPGGEKIETAKQIRAQRPERLLEAAIRGMIPHNRLGRRAFTKLKVYKGPHHPHTSQQPTAVKL